MSTACWHCGEGVGVSPFVARTPGGEKPTCCPGCAAAVEMIHRLGLEDYYAIRSNNGPLVVSEETERTLALFDVPQLLAAHIQEQDGRRRLRLQVSGLTCAACCWLIEKVVMGLPGARSVQVNLASMQLTLEYDAAEPLFPRNAVRRILELGYRVALPGDPTWEGHQQKERRRLLGRLALAGLGAMQAMMYSAALYIGVFEGTDRIYQDLFRLAGLLVATPVVFYSGWPFFQGAWRSLKVRRPTMDLPVALALLLAWGGSLVVMASGGEHVYFDSAAMFVFFLLLSRWLELHQRQRIQRSWQQLQDTLPLVVRRLDDAGGGDWVATAQLCAGDTVRVSQGETVPVDGVIRAGEARFNEAALTGESLPRTRTIGDTVQAGCRILEGGVDIEATSAADSSLVARIGEQVARAQEERVTVVRDWQRVAPLFTATVLALAMATLVLHWHRGPAQAFEHMLALLVVTCPCALALAVPLTLSATLARGLKLGLLIASPSQFLSLPGIRGVLFDKTGTLTTGRFQRVEWRAAADVESEWLTTLPRIAAGLERDHPHPLARAFDDLSPVPIEDLRLSPAGASGRFQGHQWAMGGAPELSRGSETCLALTRDGRTQALFWLRDQPRAEAPAVLDQLRQRGWRLRMASGDAAEPVATLAEELGMGEARSRLTPHDKAAWLQKLEQQEGPQMMVGDGINDAPALLRATVSVAPAAASSLARRAAGVYLLNEGLQGLADLPRLADRCRVVIRQNLTWALGYNLVAIPLAMAGWIPPWAAALGMSASSLLVTLNANRITTWKASSC
ncbi:heavy metal translocating P-type ATPase [Alcanivoracaceae bacterium MT1]